MRKLIPKSRYARNVITLMTGTGLAQAIPIAITPILTRLYTPEDFGLVALFVACASVLSILATGRYELAITLPESDKEAANLLVLTLKLCAVTSFCLIIPIALLNEWIAEQLGNSEIAPWLYLLPISVMALGTYNAMQMWLNRYGLYKQMSMNRLQNSGYNAVINLSLGFIKFPAGLIWASTFGQVLAALTALWRSYKQDEQLFSQSDWEAQKKISRRYQHHPKHILPGQLIGAVAIQIPIFVMTSVYSLAAAGFFALAYRLVVMPTSLIASSIGDVYRQRIAKEYQEKGEFRAVYLKTVKTTAVIALPICLLMYLFSPIIFSVVLGKEWYKAGEYAQILVIAVYFQMIFTPIDKGAVLVGATKYIFLWHLTRLVLLVMAYLASNILLLKIETFLWCLVIVNIFLYTLDGYIEFLYSKNYKSYSKGLK